MAEDPTDVILSIIVLLLVLVKESIGGWISRRDRSKK